jgi:signal transduction histidine kinase
VQISTVIDKGDRVLNLLLEHLAKTWHIEVLYSLPATFIYFSFSLIFFGHAFHTFWKKLAILVLIQGWFVDTLIIYIPGYLQGFNTITSYFLLTFIFFRQFSLRDKIRIPILMFVITILIELLIANILLFFYRLDELTNPLVLVIFFWPIILFFGIISYKLNKKRIHLGQRFYEFVTGHKSIFYLCLVLVLQLITVGALSASSINKKSNLTILNFLVAVSIILSFAVIYLVLNFYSKTKSQVFKKTEEMYIEQMNTLFTSIKSQRHDFLNNAQVMIAMLYRQDKEGLQGYLKEYIQELQEISDIIIINEPAISALIQTKKIFADQQNIQFEFHFSGLEKINMGIKIIDVVKILGNLLDNALDEVMKLPEELRYVGIVCWIESRILCFNVSNSIKEVLNTEQVDRMFEANYTNKEYGHLGLGLAIVKQKVEQLKGEISVLPEMDTITFNVRLPLKNNEIKNVVY